MAGAAASTRQPGHARRVAGALSVRRPVAALPAGDADADGCRRADDGTDADRSTDADDGADARRSTDADGSAADAGRAGEAAVDGASGRNAGRGERCYPPPCRAAVSTGRSRRQSVLAVHGAASTRASAGRAGSDRFAMGAARARAAAAAAARGRTAGVRATTTARGLRRASRAAGRGGVTVGATWKASG